MKTKNHSVKNRVSRTQGTVLFSKERAKLKIAQSKIALTVPWWNAIFREKRKAENRSVRNSINGTQGTEENLNHPVKNGVNGTQGTMLFSQERAKLKITQSRIALTVQMVQCYFPRKGETENSSVKNSVNGT